jgi:hypothetical protein
MSCPFFREGYFGVCVAPEGIHVPNLQEMEDFCFRSWYERCPHLVASKEFRNQKKVPPPAGVIKRMTSV